MPFNNEARHKRQGGNGVISWTMCSDSSIYHYLSSLFNSFFKDLNWSKSCFKIEAKLPQRNRIFRHFCHNKIGENRKNRKDRIETPSNHFCFLTITFVVCIASEYSPLMKVDTNSGHNETEWGKRANKFALIDLVCCINLPRMTLSKHCVTLTFANMKHEGK